MLIRRKVQGWIKRTKSDPRGYLGCTNPQGGCYGRHSRLSIHNIKILHSRLNMYNIKILLFLNKYKIKKSNPKAGFLIIVLALGCQKVQRLSYYQCVKYYRPNIFVMSSSSWDFLLSPEEAFDLRNQSDKDVLFRISDLLEQYS